MTQKKKAASQVPVQKSPELDKKILNDSKENRITCAIAHKIALQFNVTPLEIGEALDRLGLKITQCQLGLFGYGKLKKKLDPAIDLSSDEKKQIRATQTNGCLSCLLSWQLAQKTGLSRLDMGSACEKEKIRIKPCQLGAF